MLYLASLITKGVSSARRACVSCSPLLDLAPVWERSGLLLYGCNFFYWDEPAPPEAAAGLPEAWRDAAPSTNAVARRNRLIRSAFQSGRRLCVRGTGPGVYSSP